MTASTGSTECSIFIIGQVWQYWQLRMGIILRLHMQMHSSYAFLFWIIIEIGRQTVTTVLYHNRLLLRVFAFIIACHEHEFEPNTTNRVESIESMGPELRFSCWSACRRTLLQALLTLISSIVGVLHSTHPIDKIFGLLPNVLWTIWHTCKPFGEIFGIPNYFSRIFPRNKYLGIFKSFVRRAVVGTLVVRICNLLTRTNKRKCKLPEACKSLVPSASLEHASVITVAWSEVHFGDTPIHTQLSNKQQMFSSALIFSRKS